MLNCNSKAVDNNKSLIILFMSKRLLITRLKIFFHIKKRFFLNKPYLYPMCNGK